MKRFLATIAFVSAFCGVASADDVPLRNWTVPAQGGGTLSPLVDSGSPAIFVGMSPCRVADTRNAAGPYGGPKLVAGATRTFDIVGSGCTGLPANVMAYSLNFTAVTASGSGMLLAWPAGGAVPAISVLNYVAGQTVANAAIVPAGTASSISVRAGVSGTDLIIDINGYFTNALNSGEQLAITATRDGGAAMVGFNWSNANGSHGVGGYEGGTGAVHGVQGEIGTPAGARSSGVHGIGAATSFYSYGVLGESSSTSSGSAGAAGIETATSGDTCGVYGFANSAAIATAGVRGIAGSSLASAGWFTNNGATIDTYLGTTGSPGGHPGNYGLWVMGGNIYASGNIYGALKSFVAPHPTDPSKEIVYTSVEAPSADIYFRGTAQLVNGLATIEVPEHFRFSARPESYQTNLTAVGGGGTAWVEHEGPEGIVVRGTARTVHYMVYAERDVIERQLPVRENMHFDARALSRGDVRNLPEGYQELLVKNGTLNPDLTLNKQTAERLGWEIPGEGKAK